MKLNRDWHLKHKMPDRATPTERLKWHLAHAKNCKCRPLTKAFLAKLTATAK